MQIGDKIKTIYGNVETVMNVEESRITTFESFCKNSWYHPTKVFPVNCNETLRFGVKKFYGHNSKVVKNLIINQFL